MASVASLKCYPLAWIFENKNEHQQCFSSVKIAQNASESMTMLHVISAVPLDVVWLNGT